MLLKSNFSTKRCFQLCIFIEIRLQYNVAADTIFHREVAVVIYRSKPDKYSYIYHDFFMDSARNKKKKFKAHIKLEKYIRNMCVHEICGIQINQCSTLPSR